ncbi:DUF6151 family protein [Tahibacter caeni]|uniref:DUF6151 family protein n=1 Tax=Tahibacter caeni TaxID=1453545 RepID=UPI0021480C52|nr:DUF6151 family protein [Tahibacter caeni]
MEFPLRCRCGNVQATLAEPQRAARAVCYCRDCQAFARFLGRAQLTLDRYGGTDIVATSPHRLRFTRGVEELRCMSLSEKGLLRWYAGCCNTPLANTPRDPALPYVGIVYDSLPESAAARDAAFGPARIALNTASATGTVAATPWATVAGMLRILRNVVAARVSGRYRDNPFFERGSGRPVVAPLVLTPEQRRSLYG